MEGLLHHKRNWFPYVKKGCWSGSWEKENAGERAVEATPNGEGQRPYSRLREDWLPEREPDNLTSPVVLFHYVW